MTYNPVEIDRLITEAREDEGRLTAAMPNCTCTGWYDTPGNDHEVACARTRYAADFDAAVRRLRDGNLRSLISQLLALRKALVATPLPHGSSCKKNEA